MRSGPIGVLAIVLLSWVGMTGTAAADSWTALSSAPLSSLQAEVTAEDVEECPALGTSFATPATSGTISAAGEMDCYALDAVATGDRLSLRMVSTVGARWSLTDGTGVTLCASNWNSGSCVLTGAPGWSLRIHDLGGDRTFSYSVVARRLTNPQGCAPLGAPETYSFAAPRRDSSIDAALQARCFTFSRAAGEEDGGYWFRAVRSSGTVSPRWSVYGPTGASECAGSSWDYGRCGLLASGQFALVVDSADDTATGSFLLTVKKLTSATGCGTLASVGFDAAVHADSIASAGEIDCHAIPAVTAGQRVDIAFRGSTGNPRWIVVDGVGNHVCSGSSSAECELRGADSKLLIYDYSGTETFSYSLSVRRLTTPQGCQALSQPAVWSFTSPRIDGSVADGLSARCYTFTRAPGEADGAYWFRVLRTAGALGPRWRVYGPTGTRECSGSGSDVSRCALLAAGQHVIVIDDGDRSGAGSFLLTAKRINDAAGCTDLPSLAFGAEAISGALSSSGEIDCYVLPGATSSTQLDIALRATEGGVQWRVVSNTGDHVCGSPWSPECQLGGTGPWRLLVFDSGTSAPAYTLAVRRLSNPQGCVPLGAPAVWSFTAPRVNATLQGALDAKCFTFSRTLEEGDGLYWLRAIRSSGAIQPRWRLFGPSGSRECNGTTGGVSRCELRGIGQFTVVVDDSSSGGAGSFYLTPKRLTAPSGCSQLPSIAFGLAPVNGTLSVGSEIDCYTLPASSDDQLKLSMTGAADRLSVVGADGVVRCELSSWPCAIGGDGPYQLLVYSSQGTASGSYRFQATCENVPCGQSQSAVTDTVPDRIGQSPYTTVTLRGRDLHLLKDVRLRRGTATIAAQVLPAAGDGRATDARFDTAAAATGKWSVEAVFLDGTTRTLTDHLTVEPPREPAVSVQLVGRDAFRVGEPTRVTVVATNSGNIDAIAVPVILGGIPAGATVEPAFDITDIEAGATEPSSTKLATFDQRVDALTEDGEVTVPMLLARIPPGRPVNLEYRITVPTPTDVELQASAAQCMNKPVVTTPASIATARSLAVDGKDAAECFGVIGGLVADVLWPKDCEQLLNASFWHTFVGVATRDPIMKPAASWDMAFKFGRCAIDVTPVGKVARAEKLYRAFKNGGKVSSGVQLADECLLWAARSSLRQRAVFAVDPNEIRGPVGTGEGRYIAGDGRLAYQVLFENLPAATAPAQRVRIANPLDNSVFDPNSVQFTDISFGQTVYRLDYPSNEVDHVIDLRPAQNLKVRVQAKVSAGQIQWEMQAIDPETLAPPEDPLTGFLPPNKQAPNGEGAVGYSVKLRSLPSGAEVNNAASIVFDNNAPIETPTWTNRIDRLPPTPAISADADAGGNSATVSWSGTDDAAGIWLYEIRVSKDGGPFTLWKTAAAGGSSRFPATDSGSYSFRAVAHDGAGNVAQTAQRSVTLSAVAEEPVDSDGDGVADGLDACPNVRGTEANGCPPAPRDSDGDGVADNADACPNVRGTEANGCPAAPSDSDGDGVTDNADACPSVRGTELNGCPPATRDSDGDGVLDDVDACPTTPGTLNGCPPPRRDSDGDGVADDIDACPAVAGSENGCPPKDVGAPKLVAAFKSKQTIRTLTKGLVAKVNASEACSITAQLVLDESTARRLKLGTRSTVIARATVTLTREGTASPRLRLKKKAARILTRARRFSATVVLTAKDAAGNIASARRGLRITR